MTTRIPLTEFNQILQTKSSPETIAALLNEAEEKYSATPKHANAKRVYPFWKICLRCLKPYQCHTKEQAQRNMYCGRKCFGDTLREQKTGKRLKAGAVCAYCKVEFWTRSKALAKAIYCSHSCRAKANVAHLLPYAANGKGKLRPGKGLAGALNPAWKGGVTYFRKHGNYKPIKYVRCPAEYMPMARKDGYVMEHRLMVAQHLGRPLLRVEVVHHKDHDPTHNQLDNFQLFASNSDHKLYEHHGSPAPIWQL